MEVTFFFNPQIRCVYLAFGYGGMSKRTSVNPSCSSLTRAEWILCLFYLQFYVIHTDATLFQKTAWRHCCWACKCARMFDMKRFFFFLALACLHFSEVLLPVGMTTQGGIFQSLKWKPKPRWWFTLACNTLEVCQMHKNAGSILHLKGQIF